ncbi:MAG: hypothetical protein PUD89_02310 [Bacteroidales bacterium]|nr:hypothetical protein [Bacteroidales bacterium]
MKHRFLLLSSIILFATAGIGTVAASDTAVDGIYYNFDDATLTAKVTYRGAEDDWMYDSIGDLAYVGDLVIPASVTYNDKVYTVVGLDADALINSKKLLTLSLPATVTSIGDRAFTLCNALQSITVDAANPTCRTTVCSTIAIRSLLPLYRAAKQVHWNCPTVWLRFQVGSFKNQASKA